MLQVFQVRQVKLQCQRFQMLEGLGIRPDHLIHHMCPLYPVQSELPTLLDQDHECLSVLLVFIRVLISEAEVPVPYPHTLEALAEVDKVEA